MMENGAMQYQSETSEEVSPVPFYKEDAAEVLVRQTSRERYDHVLRLFKENLEGFVSNRTALSLYLKEQLTGLLAHSVNTCPFYQRRFSPAMIASWAHSSDSAESLQEESLLEKLRTLPLLLKRDIQEHYYDLWSDEFAGEKDALHYWLTSGSTGEPTQFVVDDFSALSREISFWLVQRLIGNQTLLETAQPGQSLMLRLSSNEAGPSWYKRFPFFNEALLWKMSALRHPSCDLKKPIAFLRHEKPPLLGGDPQAFLAIIETWKEIYPEETQYPYPLKGLTCGGDHLTPEARFLIESFFARPVIDTYALSEVSIVASQCTAGQCHIHWPVNLVEIVDETGQVLPEGGLGEIVVTNLMNWSFPFIRYRTGDLGRMNTTSPCSCGCVFPVLYDLQGRQSCFFVNSKGEIFSPKPLVKIFYGAGLSQYQLVQTEGNTFVLRYVHKNKAPISPQVLDELTEALSLLSGEKTISMTLEASETLHVPGKKFQEFIPLDSSTHVIPQ